MAIKRLTFREQWDDRRFLNPNNSFQGHKVTFQRSAAKDSLFANPRFALYVESALSQQFKTWMHSRGFYYVNHINSKEGSINFSREDTAMEFKLTFL